MFIKDKIGELKFIEILTATPYHINLYLLQRMKLVIQIFREFISNTFTVAA